MAGVSTTPIVNNWILDYYTYSAWCEFRKDNTISTSTLDSVAGILGKTWEGDEHRNDKKLFLTVLSRLKDGSDINMRYYEGCDDTPLEDLVPHFMNLVNLQEDEKVVKEGELLFKVISCEAVRACCRAGDFQKARDVFDKLKLQKIKDKLYISMVKDLESLIKKKDKETGLTYDDFVSTMVDYLQLIADNFEEPIIISAAKKLLNRKSCRHKETGKDTQSDNRIPSKEVLDEIENEDKSNNNNKLSPKSEKQRLRKLWDQNIKEMFGDDDSPTHENPTHENQTEEENSDSLFANTKKPSGSKSNKRKTSTSKKSSPTKNESQYFKVPSKTPKTNPVETRSTTPKKSPPKQNESPLFKVPSKKSTPNPSESRTSTPKVGRSGAKSPFNRSATINGNSKMSSPISTVSPVQRPSTPDRSGEDSPEFRYRKNKGRADRHEPVSSTRSTTGDNCSVISDLSSMYGGTKKRKWTEDEMNEFYDAVVTMGVGRWAQIRDYLNTTRTGVMLKDKWRNMINSGDVERIKEKRQKKK